MDLRLPLKKKWFEMTKAGIKTEDYREITPYWIKRLFLHRKEKLTNNLTENEIGIIWADFDCCIDKEDALWVIDNYYLSFKPFICNTMTLGYPKKGEKEKIIQFEHAGIEIRTGNPDWGAEPDKLYFVIKHGKSL